MPKRKVELTRELVERLSQSMSDADAAKHLGITMVPFYTARKAYGIPSFFQRTGLRKKKTGEVYSFYDYDERYFQDINTPEKAYFLGLIASDGNINNRLTAVRIALKEHDSDVLEAFRRELGDGAPPLKRKIPSIKGVYGEPQTILVLSRIAMVRDLVNRGIIPDKSLDFCVTGDLGPGNAFARDFLRGVWDGDGSVTERRFKVTTGSPAFAGQLQMLIHDVSGRELPVKKERNNGGNELYNISGYIRDAVVIQSIYRGSTLGIERKRQSYLRYWEPRR